MSVRPTDVKSYKVVTDHFGIELRECGGSRSYVVYVLDHPLEFAHASSAERFVEHLINELLQIRQALAELAGIELEVEYKIEEGIKEWLKK